MRFLVFIFAAICLLTVVTAYSTQNREAMERDYSDSDAAEMVRMRYRRGQSEEKVENKPEKNPEKKVWSEKPWSEIFRI